MMNDEDIFLGFRRALTATDGPAILAALSKSLGKRDLSQEGFKDFMCGDLTFGGFGMPIPQHDTFLRVELTTTFQPHDASVLRNPQDVLFLLTPIVRILMADGAILMRLTNFEGSESVPLARLLPYRPRSAGFEQHQYASLVELTMSVWFIMCHAYVELMGTKRVRSLVCYGQNGQRAPHVWINLNTECAAQFLRRQQERPDARKHFAELKAETDIVRIVSVYPSFSRCVVVLDDLIVFSRLGTDTEQKSRYLEHDEPVPKDAIYIETASEEPYFWVVQGTGSGFLLLTIDGCTYSAFYRLASWSENGLTTYPLLMHPHNAHLYDQDDPETVVFSGVCANCGQMTGNGTRCNNLIYCNSRCVTEALDAKAERYCRENPMFDTVDALVKYSARGKKFT